MRAVSRTARHGDNTPTARYAAFSAYGNKQNDAAQ